MAKKKPDNRFEKTVEHMEKVAKEMRAAKVIEIEGIWSDGEVHGKVCSSICSTGVAMLYLQGQRHKACKARLWLVRFFRNGKLIREWDEINQKYNLEVG